MRKQTHGGASRGACWLRHAGIGGGVGEWEILNPVVLLFHTADKLPWFYLLPNQRYINTYTYEVKNYIVDSCVYILASI